LGRRRAINKWAGKYNIYTLHLIVHLK